MTEDDRVSRETKADELLSKVEGWLDTEGYPLEFETAAAFRDAGFRVLQAEYTKPTPRWPRREVDVVAHMSQFEDHLLRVEFVVECKWSRDKPWVFFCGGRGMAPAASAAQSIGSQLGETLLWKEAGNPSLESLGLFASTGRSAFGGRQAFSKQTDVVFDAIRSVTSNCRALADAYDRDVDRAIARARLPENGVAFFPVVVVDGRLFSAQAGETGMAVEEVSTIRVHFRGAEDHRFPIATVDVVRADRLEQFVNERAADARELVRIMSTALSELRDRMRDGHFDRLHVTAGSRGVLGPPFLLAALVEAQREAAARGLDPGGPPEAEYRRKPDESAEPPE